MLPTAIVGTNVRQPRATKHRDNMRTLHGMGMTRGDSVPERRSETELELCSPTQLTLSCLESGLYHVVEKQLTKT